MKKVLAALLAVMLLVSLFSACNAGGGKTAAMPESAPGAPYADGR
jgi:hypothetical protein